MIHDIHARKTFYTIYPPKNIPNCGSGQCTIRGILVRTYLILSLYPPMGQYMIPDIQVRRTLCLNLQMLIKETSKRQIESMYDL